MGSFHCCKRGTGKPASAKKTHPDNKKLSKKHRGTLKINEWSKVSKTANDQNTSPHETATKRHWNVPVSQRTEAPPGISGWGQHAKKPPCSLSNWAQGTSRTQPSTVLLREGQKQASSSPTAAAICWSSAEPKLRGQPVGTACLLSAGLK